MPARCADRLAGWRPGLGEPRGAKDAKGAGWRLGGEPPGLLGKDARLVTPDLHRGEAPAAKQGLAAEEESDAETRVWCCVSSHRREGRPPWVGRCRAWGLCGACWVPCAHLPCSLRRLQTPYAPPQTAGSARAPPPGLCCGLGVSAQRCDPSHPCCRYTSLTPDPVTGQARPFSDVSLPKLYTPAEQSQIEGFSVDIRNRALQVLGPLHTCSAAACPRACGT